MARSIKGQVGISTSMQYDPGLALGTGGFQFPNINAYTYDIGTTVGKFNVVAVAAGTAASAPSAFDLTTILDPFGAAAVFAKVNYILICNDATADGSKLLLDGTVTNAWTSWCNSIATSKLVIPSGFVDPGNSTSNIPGMALLFGGNTTGLGVGGSNKIISLDPGANTIPWRVFLLGR